MSSQSSDAPFAIVKNRRSLLALAAAVGLLLASCGSDGEQKSCDDDENPSIPSAPATALIRSQLKLETRTSFDADGIEQKQDNIASIVFVDSRRVERINRSTNDQKFSMTCSGLTGAPTDQCREPYTEDCVRVQLDVDKVEVSGVPGGLTMEKKGTGTYVNAEAPDPLFGPEDVSVVVTGKDDEAFFPSFELALTPPKELTLEKPTAKDLIGSRDLEICWNGADGDLIEISIDIERANSTTTDTDKVVCLVRDDGCHIVPIGAFDWLRLGDMKPEDLFKLTLIRQKIAIKNIDEETAAELKAAHRVELLLHQDE